MVLLEVQAQSESLPCRDVIPCVIQDVQASQVPDRVQLRGFIGERIQGNESARLAQVDTGRLLEGYRKRPGRQSWDGEHVGKWLHAATLAWVNSGDKGLRAKMDETAAALVACQLPDGYLGTYLEKNRWTEWDVWAHKYNLIGLLTYVRYTGNRAPLEACRRMADLLCSEFGDKPGQKDIITQGGSQHVGMASTSVLEAMVLMYRFTGEQRYLDFCHYIVRAWETPAGPHILSRLLAGKGVNAVGNGKAYEMLSCLNGALELYRTTGDERLLKVCLAAWQDIVSKRLYITGTASWRELFHEDYDLQRANNTGETCVTVTWLQLNAQLLRLTGEARFAQQLERLTLNQLFGGEHPDCRKWSYYVEQEGRKRYTDNLDGQCCLSSGPRGVALLPTFAISTDRDGIVVNLYDRGGAVLKVGKAGEVRVSLDTKYPADGHIDLRLELGTPAEFLLKLRIPEWAAKSRLSLNGKETALQFRPDGYAFLQREWCTGDVVTLEFPMEPVLVAGDHVNEGRFALCYGPLVFALDEASLASSGQSISTVRLVGEHVSELGLTLRREEQVGRSAGAGLSFEGHVTACKAGSGVKIGDRLKAVFVPFSEVGAQGFPYRIWVPGPQHEQVNLLPYGKAFSSEATLECSSVNDDNRGTNIEVIGADSAEACWFAVSMESPAHFSRFVYSSGSDHWSEHGIRYPGWFDSSAGKPRIEVQKVKGGSWEPVGVLANYPETTATSSAGIRDGQCFELVLNAPVSAVAVRVIGRASAGGTPEHSRASISELEAYGTR